MQTNGTIHAGDGVAVQAQSDLTTTYNVLMGLPSTPLTGNLGGQTLTAGVYSFATSAQLTGTLTLQGGADDVFVIQIGSTLTTASSSSIILSGAVNPANVFFVVGSSATLGTYTAFKGQIVALESISLDTTAKIDCGAAWARNGAVTLDNNTINICTFTVASGTFGSKLGPDASEQSIAVAKALDDAAAAGSPLPIGFGVLSLLTPDQQDEAYNQISGETASGVAYSAIEEMNSFLDTALDLGRGGPGSSGMSENNAGSPADSGPGTVSVMGYSAPSSPVANSAFAQFDQPQRTDVLPDLRLRLWAAGFGGFSRTSGDAVAGTHDRTSHSVGLAAGIDDRIAPDTTVGVVVGGANTTFSLSDGLGNGQLGSGNIAVYGRKDIGPAYVLAGLGYGYSAVSTDRYITFAGLDDLTVNFATHDIAAQIEGGYQVGIVTPYAALRGHALRTPAYDESAASGNSTFALSYDGSTVLALRSEVGVKLDWVTAMEEGTLGIHTSAAWAHDSGSGVLNASFEEVPDASFAVRGATAYADSLLLAARIDMQLTDGFNLAGSVNSQLARNAQTYSGNVRLGYSW